MIAGRPSRGLFEDLRYDPIRDLGKQVLMRTPYHNLESGMRQCGWCNFESTQDATDRDSHSIDCSWVAAHEAWQKETKLNRVELTEQEHLGHGKHEVQD